MVKTMGTIKLTKGKVLVGSISAAEVAHFDVVLTAAQILALSAAPQTIVPAPGASKAIVFDGCVLSYDFVTTAYGGIAVGEDLVVKYTNGAGAAVSESIETIGFLDQVADQNRFARPIFAAVTALAPIVNAPLVLQILTGEITTGDGLLRVRTYYRTVPVL